MVPEGVRNGENVKFSGGMAFVSEICKTLVFNGICVKRKTASTESRSGLKQKKWSGWRESNSRPLVPQTNALTRLRYIPFFQKYES